MIVNGDEFENIEIAGLGNEDGRERVQQRVPDVSPHHSPMSHHRQIPPHHNPDSPMSQRDPLGVHDYNRNKYVQSLFTN